MVNRDCMLAGKGSYFWMVIVESLNDARPRYAVSATPRASEMRRSRAATPHGVPWSS